MRTTLTLDDDVLAVAREIAEQRRVSIGEVVSELSRQGIAAQRKRIVKRSGIPSFVARPNAAPITSEAIKAALDDE